MQLNLLKKYAEQQNIQIINATEGGLLNIFPRESFDTVIQDIASIVNKGD